MNDVIIRTENLCKQFQKKRVLAGLDFQVGAGEVVGMLGSNGSGKTTLLKCILGLLKVTSGSSSVFGQDSWDLDASAKARIGYVSQDFALLPWMTVQGLTEYTGAFYDRWDQEFVNLLLNKWKLDQTERVGTLSGGQRQKLAVIVALGHRPDLLVLDEPVASLDPAARRQFLQSLIEFTENEAHTILFSSHITSDLERIASHVAFLVDGKIRFKSELDSLKNQVKRIRITAAENLPPSLGLPGTLREQIDGNHGLLAVTDFESLNLEQLSRELQATATVEDLNLEEIFLEVSGAPVQPEVEAVS
ncbi:putative ABC transporter ATP-binding protein YxlF [Gimesia panareensis]|uniref:Putative ABC transporter ATP-binding protein YxlF n=1 Tax=Gimesia panareensis TaxID=2527978 RepID=A0A518FRZ7_9PLAN|nr:ABC transporter ATP-binding protein [Gimesia panareensis]QDV19119.1 putative ABC transporter ATP-binding protein YxlF [Gimesia panareensis]